MQAVSNFRYSGATGHGDEASRPNDADEMRRDGVVVSTAAPVDRVEPHAGEAAPRRPLCDARQAAAASAQVSHVATRAFRTGTGAAGSSRFIVTPGHRRALGIAYAGGRTTPGAEPRPGPSGEGRAPGDRRQGETDRPRASSAPPTLSGRPVPLPTAADVPRPASLPAAATARIAQVFDAPAPVAVSRPVAPRPAGLRLPIAQAYAVPAPEGPLVSFFNHQGLHVDRTGALYAQGGGDWYRVAYRGDSGVMGVFRPDQPHTPLIPMRFDAAGQIEMLGYVPGSAPLRLATPGELMARVRQLTDSGIARGDIAKTLGISRSEVIRLQRATPLDTMYSPALTTHVEAQVLAIMTAGNTPYEIMRDLQIPRHVVSRIAAGSNLLMEGLAAIRFSAALNREIRALLRDGWRTSEVSQIVGVEEDAVKRVRKTLKLAGSAQTIMHSRTIEADVMMRLQAGWPRAMIAHRLDLSLYSVDAIEERHLNREIASVRGNPADATPVLPLAGTSRGEAPQVAAQARPPHAPLPEPPDNPDLVTAVLNHIRAGLPVGNVAAELGISIERVIRIMNRY